MDVLNTAVRLPHWAAIMREEAISEKTPVRLGLLIMVVTTALGLIFGGASGIWWWASWSSKVDTKLNSIETLVTTMGLTDSTRDKQLDDVDRRVMRLETVGSPAVQQIQKDITELLRKFDMHMAKEQKP